MGQLLLKEEGQELARRQVEELILTKRVLLLIPIQPLEMYPLILSLKAFQIHLKFLKVFLDLDLPFQEEENKEMFTK